MSQLNLVNHTKKGNTMTSIHQTVEQALMSEGRGTYLNYATGVIEALTAREEEIKDNLRTYANSRGLQAEEVEALFVEVGLSEPTPEPIADPVAEAPAGGDLGTLVQQAVERAVQPLVAFARQHGYRG